jgi:leucyl aminopeptidase (aminopeptidase T)
MFMGFEKEPHSVEKISSLIDTILEPKQNERFLFITDYQEKMSEEDKDRRNLVLKWYSAAKVLSAKKKFKLLPLVVYKETLKHNADLPKTAATIDGGHVNDLVSFLGSADIIVTMTKYSASAPIKKAASKSARVVSMPGIREDMEPAMLADYKKIGERAQKLVSILQNAVEIELVFDGAEIPKGTVLFVDVRKSKWFIDSGICKNKGDFINFPSGEVFAAPYEGISEQGRLLLGESKTRGIWPIYSFQDKKVAFLKVEKNKITKVTGDSVEALRIIEDIAKDQNAANIAEVAFGLNEKARDGPDIPILEKEKAGPHIAYGRNDHFSDPFSFSGKVQANVHIDYVYTQNTPITVSAFAIFENGNKVLIAQRGKVVI